MKIEFSKQSSDALDISVSQAVLLILHNEGFQLEESLIEYLSKEGLLIAGKPSKVLLDRLHYSFNDQIPVELDTLFRELLTTYPEFDNLRPLRDTSDKVRRRYLKTINYSPEAHKRVIEALEREKRLRQARRSRGEFVESWKSLSKYVENEGWNLYPDTIEETRYEPHIGYGEHEL